MFFLKFSAHVVRHEMDLIAKFNFRLFADVSPDFRIFYAGQIELLERVRGIELESALAVHGYFVGRRRRLDQIRRLAGFPVGDLLQPAAAVEFPGRRMCFMTS